MTASKSGLETGLESSLDLHLDEHGHLLDATQWDDEVFVALCQLEQIEPTEQRLRIAKLIREFQATYKVEPYERVLMRYLNREAPELAINSISILGYLPNGLLRQGAMIAGLPLPKSCINAHPPLRPIN